MPKNTQNLNSLLKINLKRMDVGHGLLNQWRENSDLCLLLNLLFNYKFNFILNDSRSSNCLYYYFSNF